MSDNINEEMRKFIDEWRLEMESYQNIGGTFIDVDSSEESESVMKHLKNPLKH